MIDLPLDEDESHLLLKTLAAAINRDREWDDYEAELMKRVRDRLHNLIRPGQAPIQ